jgi:hypothetical protein
VREYGLDQFAQDRKLPVAASCELGKEPSGFIEGGVFLA